MNTSTHDGAYSRRILVIIALIGIGSALPTGALAAAAGAYVIAAVQGALVLGYGGLGAHLQWGRPRDNLKAVMLTLGSVQCGVVAVAGGLGGAAVSPVLVSMVIWLLMYHERARLRVIGAAHAAAAVALLWAAPVAPAGTAWLSCLILAVLTLAFVAAATISDASNRRYWRRMKRLERELGAKEASLRQTTAQLTAQHAELHTAAAALRVAAAANAPRAEALRLACEEQAQIAEATSAGLREPLRNIRQFVQLTHRRLNRLGLGEGVAEYLDFVTDGAARMNGMVDDLLRYSDRREEAAAEPVDTAEVLRSIRDNLRDLLAREGATLHFPDDLPTVLGHRTQVLQLFQNLISNGVKFKRPGVAPRCEVTCVAEDGVAGFSVSDNGIGIPAGRLGDVFGLFTRLHERGAYEGTGIGLATCRRIVLAAGGEIWAESEVGAGTTFRFTWPAPQASPQAPEGDLPERLARMLAPRGAASGTAT